MFNVVSLSRQLHCPFSASMGGFFFFFYYHGGISFSLDFSFYNDTIDTDIVIATQYELDKMIVATIFILLNTTKVIS